ncbi:phosphotransferase [Streptomyces aurantiogriseus]|uniref:Ternary complex associated domain-containing protein n=1 Tax=Streptomyces aurantiogriseus TaxID=66870 RepID=A0A918FI26_9ACTN|nr:phosphotransferase [Streptomyces aurantiogriseus]GGR38983.1 hypothetical protein GCM10010251_64500 [Streptomyces aurantiogriseus]
MSPEDFQQALALTKAALRDAFQADPELEHSLPKAGPGLQKAAEQLAAGNLVGPVFQIANAAHDLVAHHYLQADAERARLLLELAVRLYESNNSTGTFNRSLDSCRNHLDTLGLTPIQHAAAPDVVEVRSPDAAALYIAVPKQTTPTATRPVPDTEVTDGTEPDGPANWERFLEEWRSGAEGETPVRELIEGLGEQITGLLAQHAPAAAERLRPLIEQDLRLLGEHLDGVMVPLEDSLAIHQRAKDARRASSQATTLYAKGDTVVGPAALRTRWLTSALWNRCLRRHMHTNDHQTVTDVLGYLQVFQIENRHRNEQRELLLTVTEATTLLTVGELQPFDLKRLWFVHGWLRHAVGIQLHIGGPDPLEPSVARRHDRVRDPHDDRRSIHAEQWATHLLNQWVDKQEYWRSVAFILLILSGWKTDQLERLLEALYPTSPLANKARDFWHQQAMDMLAKTRTVRVVKNAWEPGVATASSSLSMRDRDDDFLQLPNRLLQGVVAELAPRSHGTVVQGALFADRPVPTFLASDNFGPVGILKIDEAGKVQREKENFDEFGELLHPYYRSSKCVVGTTTIPNSSNGERYQAILTSYVFRESDKPTTLRGWLCKSGDLIVKAAGADKQSDRGHADDEVLRDVMQEVFLKALGPWLSNASRTIGDLRGEYPALRPASFERTSYAPGKDAESELAHFQSQDVAETFGIEGGLPWRPPALGPLLENSGLGRSPLVTERDIEVTNPLWLVAHAADVQRPDEDTAPLIDWLLYDPQYGMTTRSYLTCVSHGDLHGENILATGPDDRSPALYIIDFETTHRGHICKDFARLESALWSRTFPWNAGQLAEIRTWFAGALHGEDLWTAHIPEDADPQVRRVLTCVTKLRSILRDCEQRNWPFGDLEYQWALLASLLPFARYRDHHSRGNRHLPFLLAADVADVLVTKARSAV